jgi:hypothetical protein
MLPIPDDVVHFGLVVEGQGEVAAVPLLIRRICGELFGIFAVRVAHPVRITKSKILRPEELERAVQFALNRNDGLGPVIVLLDADDDCPAALGPALKDRAFPLAQARGVSIVVAKSEFEAWFLASAHSLSGRSGLRESLEPPADPEGIRGAKAWLSRNMLPGRKYSPTVDQAALVAGMDLNAAKACQSFDRLCREIERLVRQSVDTTF